MEVLQVMLLLVWLVVQELFVVWIMAQELLYSNKVCIAFDDNSFLSLHLSLFMHADYFSLCNIYEICISSNELFE